MNPHAGPQVTKKVHFPGLVHNLLNGKVLSLGVMAVQKSSGNPDLVGYTDTSGIFSLSLGFHSLITEILV